MAYTPNSWAPGEIITKTKLDRLEAGAAAALPAADAAAVATSGLYNDLTGKPTIPAAYTDEQVRDVIGATLVAGSNVTIIPDDAGNTITIAAASYTDEQVQDAVGALIAAGAHSGISFTYDDAGNTLSATVSQNVTTTTQTGTAYTLALADANTVVESNNAAAVTVTVPPNSSTAFPVGTTIALRQYGAGQVTVTPGAGVAIRSRGGALKLAGQYAEASLTKRATDEWVLSGDLTA